MKSQICTNLCTVPLDSNCSVVTSQILKEYHWEGDIHKINEIFEKSYLLIGLSKFAETFAVRFLKSSSIHPICINAWGSFSFNYYSLVAYITVEYIFFSIPISLILIGAAIVIMFNMTKHTHLQILTSKSNREDYCRVSFS